MWRKICKEELRETRKVYFVMFAILLAAGIISLVVMRQTALYPGDTFGGTPEEFDVRSVLSIGSILGMYVLWIAAMVVYVVYTLYRFDRLHGRHPQCPRFLFSYLVPSNMLL